MRVIPFTCKVVLEWNEAETEVRAAVRKLGDNENSFGNLGGMMLLCDAETEQIAGEVLARAEYVISEYGVVKAIEDADRFAERLGAYFRSIGRAGQLEFSSLRPFVGLLPLEESDAEPDLEY
ncbi:MAG: hypothetical protein WC813_00230 [Patescibacteria group bacterium]|jgi:hypothetical protein